MQKTRSLPVFVAILCLFILIDEIDSLRVRMPSIRISATFSKTAAYIKKKFGAVHGRAADPQEPTILKPSGQENDNEL